MSRRRVMTTAGLLACVSCAWAHEPRPAFLDIKETASGRYEVLWRTPLNAGMRLPIALRFGDDVRNLTEPVVQELNDSLIERLSIDTGPEGLAGRRIGFAGLEATITDVLVRVELRDGRHWTSIVRPSQGWIEIAAGSALAVAEAYTAHGIQHIAFGADHLLFILGLLLIVNDRWMLLKTVTAFTIAHSITLAIATLVYAPAPAVPLNATIALSVLFVGTEIVRVWRGEMCLTIRRPWVVAFLFGLLHGFGFASALTSVGLPGAELPIALLTFNLGVEIGQVSFVLLIIALQRSFRELEIRWPRWAAALPGYAVGSLGAFWTIQRATMRLGVK